MAHKKDSKSHWGQDCPAACTEHTLSKCTNWVLQMWEVLCVPGLMRRRVDTKTMFSVSAASPHSQSPMVTLFLPHHPSASFSLPILSTSSSASWLNTELGRVRESQQWYFRLIVRLGTWQVIGFYGWFQLHFRITYRFHFMDNMWCQVLWVLDNWLQSQVHNDKGYSLNYTTKNKSSLSYWVGTITIVCSLSLLFKSQSVLCNDLKKQWYQIHT